MAFSDEIEKSTENLTEITSIWKIKFFKTIKIKFDKHLKSFRCLLRRFVQNGQILCEQKKVLLRFFESYKKINFKHKQYLLLILL